MATTTISARPSVGERKQLATYSLPAGDRVIYGQPIRGHVRLIDAPAVAGESRSWIIESNLEQEGKAAMEALIADYLAQANPHRTIPAGPATLRPGSSPVWVRASLCVCVR